MVDMFHLNALVNELLGEGEEFGPSVARDPAWLQDPDRSAL
jgi:hypothetical protein